MSKYNYDEIFNYIVKHKENHDGNSPTIRAIKRAFAISSTSVVDYILNRLEKEGKIYRIRADDHFTTIGVHGGSWTHQ
jgi:hypothetical protein